ncbi:unnamed protein product [Caenorhabditis angaria]|uniref:Nucleolar protein 16 n=1 Tax=Caenorhabditis angaria TaxID=860376 RepID=A0A9P1I978_9PELO|nr:unnamed protein product [Caenorhabditis angaria]
MPKDVKKRGGPKYVNRRNKAKYLQKKENKKKLSKSQVPIIKYNWDETKTPRENIQDMGIAFDPNEVVKMDSGRKEIIDAVPIEGEDNLEPVKPEKKVTRRPKNQKQADYIVQRLEEEAKEANDKIAGQNRKFRLFHRETELCVYMLARHGDDFQAMTRDPKNLWQYTPKQWAKKIRTYQDSEMCKFIDSV